MYVTILFLLKLQLVIIETVEIKCSAKSTSIFLFTYKLKIINTVIYLNFITHIEVVEWVD